MERSLSILIFVFFGTTMTSAASGATEDLSYAPPAFRVGEDKYVPVDILETNVTWEVSDNLSFVSGRADLKFAINEQGKPFFLLNPNSVVHLNAQTVAIQRLTAPEFQRSSFFTLMKVFDPGVHQISVEYTFNPNPAESHFLPVKYHSHKFGEDGIPSNLTYDHFQLNLSIKTPSNKNLKVIANGKVTKNGERYDVQFPATFTSMTFFIDIVEADALVQEEFDLTSMDGRTIPVLLYSTKDDTAKDWIPTYRGLLKFSLAKLEQRFGSYPYPAIIFKSANRIGGGAYAGALVLPEYYLEHVTHELSHSWFMQGITPARSGDMWIFEGLGRWAPRYTAGTLFDPNFRQSIDALANSYGLTQHYNAHDTGAAVFGALARRLESRGGIMSFLKRLHELKKHQTLSTREFKAIMESLTGESLNDLFDFYFVSY